MAAPNTASCTRKTDKLAASGIHGAPGSYSRHQTGRSSASSSSASMAHTATH